MKFDYYVGIDVSKETLDFTVIEDGSRLFHSQTPNTASGIRSFFKAQPQLETTSVLYCMEHTGIYNNPLLDYFEKHPATLWVQSAKHIKQSLGVLRGKDDKIDSYRIALYAYRHRDAVRLWQPTPKVIKELKHMLTLREQLVKTRVQLFTSIKQISGFVDEKILKLQKATVEPVLVKIDQQLKTLDQKINQCLQGDPLLKPLYRRVTSVDHIGPITAAHVIACTKGFTDFTDPKKFACYCGVVPFNYRSGTSMMGKSRVSHLANKRIKTLLHLAAMSAIRGGGDLQQYYQRKTEQGKNKMSVLNAIRNKLIHRIFAVVRDQREYEKIYIPQLV